MDFSFRHFIVGGWIADEILMNQEYFNMMRTNHAKKFAK